MDALTNGTVALTALERTQLQLALLHAELTASRVEAAQLRAEQAQQAAIALVRELLLTHGHDPATVAQWRVDAAQGVLLRQGAGTAGDPAGPGAA